VATIVVENLYKKCSKSFCLQDISFKVHAGEIFALCGMTGSGKSTVTKILHKLYHADKGTVEFDKYNTGVFIQEQEFYKKKTVIDTMHLYAKICPRHVSDAEKRNILRVVGLYNKCNVKIKDLTINRYTRFKIALAIMKRPKILILDDPFAYLTEFEKRHVRVILKTLADKFGTTILFTAPDFEGIEEIFDTAGIIDGGRMVTIKSYNELALQQDQYAKTCITTPSPNKTAIEIAEKFKYDARLFGETDVIINVHPDKAQEMYTHLREKQIEVTSVTRVNKSVSGMFHSLRMGMA